MHFGSALGMYRLAKSLNMKCNIVTEPTGDSLGKFWEELTAIPEYQDAIVTEEEAIKLISNDFYSFYHTSTKLIQKSEQPKRNNLCFSNQLALPVTSWVCRSNQ